MGLLGTKEGKIIHTEKVVDPSRVVHHNIKFLAPRVGDYEFDLFVKSNAYVGLDQKSKVKLTTLDNSTLEEYKVHPDDADLDDEPTLFEEMMTQNIEEDSDDEDDDESSDDEDDGNDGVNEAIAPKSEADMKKERLKKARNQDDDDDDDDDDEA